MPPDAGCCRRGFSPEEPEAVHQRIASIRRIVLVTDFRIQPSRTFHPIALAIGKQLDDLQSAPLHSIDLAASFPDIAPWAHQVAVPLGIADRCPRVTAVGNYPHL